MGKSSKNILVIIIPILALVLSIVAFVRDCSQDKYFADWDYMTEAARERPQICLNGEPYISEMLETSKIAVKDIVESMQSNDDSIPTLSTKLKLEITWVLPIKNKGTSIARRYVRITSDSISQLPILRNIIFQPPNKSNIICTESEKVSEMLPGDTEELTTIQHVQFFDTSNTFTLHALFLYENELGMLYDTYIWATYRIRDFGLFIGLDGKGRIGYKFDPSDLKNRIQQVGTANDSYYIYNKKEAKEIRKTIEKVRKKYLKDD